MGPLGMQEMIVIFLVALLLFGPRKLPELGKTIAKAVTEFRRAQSDLKATFEREMQNIERENEALKETTRQAAVEISGYSDFDLIGGDNHYGSLPGPSSAESASADSATVSNENSPAQAETSAGQPSTVSASDVSGAESPGESTATPEASGVEAGQLTVPRLKIAEGTVPRNGPTITQPQSGIVEDPLAGIRQATETAQNS
jgi:sec-independent protein translocase protein TatA